jgi:phosphoribosylanthranilate isomerase
LDAYTPQALGGTGQTWDWSLGADFRPACPWFLAGGLNPENVGQVLAQVGPPGIDVSSGVEKAPGDKDLAQVQQLFQALGRV